MAGVVAVHVGAGYHAENKRSAYTSLCKKACKVGTQCVKRDFSAVDIITKMVSILEDSPLTNAGIGSNLTIDGGVECDASVMDGKSLDFGSVGALYGFQNPVKVAQAILKEQSKGYLSHGRIPPCTVVAKGAVEWARSHGFSVVDLATLRTVDSRKAHLKYSRWLQSDATVDCKKENLLDTVGAVCIDSYGNVASAVSSGGLIMKHSGRIGQAAIYGAGCWAQNSVDSMCPHIAVTTSGTGEHLVKTLFAKECFNGLISNQDNLTPLPEIFRKQFVESPMLKNVPSKMAGVLSLRCNNGDDTVDLEWAHTTKSFIIGYMCAKESRPHTVISEQPSSAISGQSIVASGTNIAFR